jgi:Co/Zn/Cd efflux system component
LWWVLAINAMMFAVEIGAGFAAGSAALQADALDFLGDAANYAISLFVVGMALRYRAAAALAKGATMALFCVWVLGVTAWHAYSDALPRAFTMGGVGFTALIANAASFWLLWQHRTGDANMRSAWLRATMFLAILQCCWLPSAWSVPIPDGRTCWSRQLWPCFPYRERQRLSSTLSLSSSLTSTG